jgi:hypothetical protein
MARSVDLPAGEPLGFPRCSLCPYRRTGPARICVACATDTLEAIEPDACPVCCQILGDDGTCPNWLCGDPRRRIERIDAIAYLSGALRDRVHRYKYGGKTGWSLIFGRLVVGWLEAHTAAEPPDLIVANPTFIERDSGDVGHVERIIESASTADAEERWAFDVETPGPAIIKTGPQRSQLDEPLGPSAPPPPRCADCWRSLMPQPQRVARSSSSTTSAPLAASSMPSRTVCSRRDMHRRYAGSYLLGRRGALGSSLKGGGAVIGSSCRPARGSAHA